MFNLNKVDDEYLGTSDLCSCAPVTTAVGLADAAVIGALAFGSLDMLGKTMAFAVLLLKSCMLVVNLAVFVRLRAARASDEAESLACAAFLAKCDALCLFRIALM